MMSQSNRDLTVVLRVNVNVLVSVAVEYEEALRVS